MSMKAINYKQGVMKNAGKGGQGTRQVAGSNVIVSSKGMQHGNSGRDERNAAKAADKGNQVIGAATHGSHSYK